MVKRALFFCLAILCLAGSASAEPYFGLGGMWTDLRDTDFGIDGTGDRLTYDYGWGTFVTLGQQWKYFRLEAEAAYRRNDIDTFANAPAGGRIEAASGMVNAYFNFHLFNFHPFIGGGGGMARIKNELHDEKERDDVVAWQGMAGFTFPLNPGWLDIGYRYFTTEDPEFEDLEGEYASHNVYLAFLF